MTRHGRGEHRHAVRRTRRAAAARQPYSAPFDGNAADAFYPERLTAPAHRFGIDHLIRTKTH